jgi:hypothetical protein
MMVFRHLKYKHGHSKVSCLEAILITALEFGFASCYTNGDKQSL